MKRRSFLSILGAPLFLRQIQAQQTTPLIISCGSQTDAFFGGGQVWNSSTPGYDPTQGTGIYATLRYGTQFSYDIQIKPGLYPVTLDFVEPNKSASNQRRFSATINSDFTTGPLDLFSLAGLHIPLQKTFLILAGDGHIRINLTSSIGNAVISGIEIGNPYTFIASRKLCSGAIGASDCTGLTYISLTDGSTLLGYQPDGTFILDNRWSDVK